MTMRYEKPVSCRLQVSGRLTRLTGPEALSLSVGGLEISRQHRFAGSCTWSGIRSKAQDGADTISRIEACPAELRRLQAEKFFAG